MIPIPDKLLATIQRPAGAQVRISLGWVRSRDTISLELWSTRAGSGEPYAVPGHKVMIWGSELPEVIKALTEAQATIEQC